MKMTAALYIILIQLVFIPGVCHPAEESGADIRQVFMEANRFYQQGAYDQAIGLYEQILGKGVEGGNIYYNLGNAYFKKGRLGMSILNYERAMRFIPKDGDLIANYRHAVSKISNNIYTRKHFIIRVSDRVFGQFTADELALFLCIIYILLILNLALGLFRIVKRYVLFLLMGLLVMCFAAAAVYLKGDIETAGREAIVIKEKTDAKFEPISQATDYFVLYEGMKVTIIESKEDWYKIMRSDGKIGWIDRASADII